MVGDKNKNFEKPKSNIIQQFGKNAIERIEKIKLEDNPISLVKKLPILLNNGLDLDVLRKKSFGQNRLNGVHSEPNSFSVQSSLETSEDDDLPEIEANQSNTNIESICSSTFTSAKKLSPTNIDHRKSNCGKTSTNSTLYRQALAANSSLMNTGFNPSLPPTHPNIPLIQQNSIGNNSASIDPSCKSFLSNINSLPSTFMVSHLPAHLSKMPELNDTNSSEEESETGIMNFFRTLSAQSLPPSNNNIHTNNEETENTPVSLYHSTLNMMANDVNYQREVSLGKRIGFYRIGKELGSGNFSKVKLGIHVLTKEKVAIKIMERFQMDQKTQRLLIREIANMETTHHPNIIRLFECVETLSKVFLVMEYAGGGELYTYVHQAGKLTEQVARPLFAQIVSAVTHLHSKEISHRDIKAENVFFWKPGIVKLGDFGFSCHIESGVRLNTFCGSPPYAAPELFQDEDYDGRMVDIWALGVLLYFMLVGVTPFCGETVSDIKHDILLGSFTVPDYISPYANKLIHRMLEKDTVKRANIKELRKAYWVREDNFPKSYFELSLNPDPLKREINETEKRVWTILNKYGIDEAMILEAVGKGTRNAIIGTYRIVLYQCQTKEADEAQIQVDKEFIHLAKKNRHLEAKLKQQSKTCTII